MVYLQVVFDLFMVTFLEAVWLKAILKIWHYLGEKILT